MHHLMGIKRPWKNRIVLSDIPHNLITSQESLFLFFKSDVFQDLKWILNAQGAAVCVPVTFECNYDSKV